MDTDNSSKKRPADDDVKEESPMTKIQKVNEEQDVTSGAQTKRGSCPLCKRVGTATLTKCSREDCPRFSCNKCRFMCNGKNCGDRFCKKCSTMKCVTCTAEFCFDCAHDDECVNNPCKDCDEPHCIYCDCPSKSDEAYNCSGDYDDTSEEEESGSD